MRDLETLRRLAPSVEPAPPETVARVRRRLDRAARGRARRSSRRPVLLAAPLAAGAALALVILIGQLGTSRTFAEAAWRAAEASPRLLLEDWEVTRVDEWQAGTGEMTFTHGERTLDLHWAPRSRDSASKHGELRAGTTTVLGDRAEVWRYEGTDEYTAVWRSGRAVVEARGRAASAGEFVELLRRFERVPARTWLEAMPASAVTPAAHGGVVDEMLEGLPIPPGLDVERLRNAGGDTRDRYQLGAQVAGAVACGWFDRWAHARRTGDTAAEREATAALATSHQWPILREMEAEGDYPKVLWEYADSIHSDDGTVPAGKPGVTAAETYSEALGCRDR